MRLLSRYVPNTSLALGISDFVCLVAIEAPVLALIHARLALDSVIEALAVVLLSVVVTVTLLYAAGAYRRDAVLSRSGATPQIQVGLGFSALALIILLHLGLGSLEPDNPSFRSISRAATIVLIETALSFGALLLSRLLGAFMLRQNWLKRRVLIVGTGQRAAHLYSLMTAGNQEPALQPVFVSEAVLTGEAPANGGTADPLVSVLTEADGRPLERVADDLTVDEIVLAADERRGLAVERLLNCKATGIAVTDYSSFVERETGRVDLKWLDKSWLVYSAGFQMGPLDRGLKRLLDLTLSVGGLLVISPVLLLAAIAIRLDGPGPILYRQQRVTRGNQVFWLYKLRTMRPDAEKGGARWASARDARITRVGHFLRRTRLDEVPQLLNVLIGNMSFVGPRPERPVFTEQLAKHIPLYDLRHAVKTGLTGWAQVNYPYGASIEDARAKLEYDLYYVKNYTFLRDILIILQTLRVVLWGEGVR